MKCPRCQKEIQDDASFCSHCGLKLDKCPVCHQPLVRGSKFCSHCGSQLNSQHQESYIGGYYQPLQMDQSQNINQKVDTDQNIETSFQAVEVDKKVSKKMIIIAVILLVVLSTVSMGYLIYGPAFHLDDDSATEKESTALIPNITVAGTTSESSYFGNINQNGEACFDGTYLYVINQKGYITRMNSDLSNQKVLVKEECRYLTYTNELLYYTNSENYLCSMTSDGENQQVILEKEIYYPIIKDNKVYYQDDDDLETLHIYDMTEKQDKKINNRSTYNINVVDNKIYYTSTDGIYVIGIDGQGDEKLIAADSQEIGQIIYQNNQLYYSLGNAVVAYHIDTKEIETIIRKDVSKLLNMTDDQIYYYSLSGSLRTYNRETQKSQMVLNSIVNCVYIIGDKLVVRTQAYSDEIQIIVMDKTGDNQYPLPSNSGTFI